MSIGRAQLFIAMTRLLETEFLNMHSGIEDDYGQDENVIHADQFIRFFEEFWARGWIGEKRNGFFHNWARHAAGMIENITLQSQDWIDRNGERLEVLRYVRPEEL
jgi:hypothetical protein